jgi:hypothetical protein
LTDLCSEEPEKAIDAESLILLLKVAAESSNDHRNRTKCLICPKPSKGAPCPFSKSPNMSFDVDFAVLKRKSHRFAHVLIQNGRYD